MRILWITPRISTPPTDGGSIVSYNLIAQLVARGHSVTLVIIRPDKNNYTALKDICSPVCVPFIERKPTFQFWASIRTGLPFNIVPYASGHVFDLLRSLRKDSFHTVVLDHLHTGLYLPILRSVTAGKVVLLEHNVEFAVAQEFVKHRYSFPLREILLRHVDTLKKFELTVASQVDSCLVLSSEDKECLQKYCPRAKLNVIPPGVDVRRYRPLGLNPIRKSMVFVGSLDWFPNKDGILWFVKDVLPHILREEPFAILYIVGKGGERIRRLQSKNVVITGLVADERPYIDSADVFIVPIRFGGGVRIKILCSMAMGKPIVSTAAGAKGLSPDIEQHVMIRDDPSDFASAVLQFLRRDSPRDEATDNARELVTTMYSWDRIAEEFERNLL